MDALLRLFQNTTNGIKTCINMFDGKAARNIPRNSTSIKILERRSKRKTDEVVAWRIEQIPAVRRVNVEENARYNYSLLLE
jgi:hypothetical protein